jgi:hypothetical protein
MALLDEPPALAALLAAPALETPPPADVEPAEVLPPADDPLLPQPDSTSANARTGTVSATVARHC